MAELTVADFIGGPVAKMLDDARPKLHAKNHPVGYSDLRDGDGHQYVDLVMGGGGVLGIALVGYTYALEELGLRFLGIGGTSAGSINALALAAFGRSHEARSVRMLPALANLPLWSFVDGPHASRSVVRGFLRGESGLWKGVHIARESRDFLNTLGLNPGQAFHRWLKDLIGGRGITTAKQLGDQLAEVPPGLLLFADEDGLSLKKGLPLPPGQGAGSLGLVATDITTQTKAVFPRMAPLYWPKPDEVNPADFVRASMSIPLFYHPMRVTEVPQGPAAERAWVKAMRYDRFKGVKAFPPAEVAFVDGGVLSNFPIDMFHQPLHVPAAPTFGVKLGADPDPVPHFAKPLEYAQAVFYAAKNAADHDFIEHNPDFAQLVATVKTDENWLNFDMDDAAKKGLFEAGVAAAIDFLKGFDWAAYKKTRAELAGANAAASTARNAKAYQPVPPAAKAANP